ncbi:MAG: hypothetical protein L3J39_01985 [Verrucomicrobiales bacterium]|nr:hypothetical protein [Verrucomicrobiales bacterium]
MKSAYDLAMEKLDKSSPAPKLTDAQRETIAKIDDKCKAKVAEKELFLGDQISKAMASGQYDQIPLLEEQRSREIQKLRSDCEKQKEEVHAER